MANWSFARAAMLACLAAGGTPALADETGCATLARWVSASVAAAAGRQGLRESQGAAARAGRGARAEARSGGRYTCSSTAAVASRAFTGAVSGLDVKLAWNDGWIRPGDVCLSHYLSQCYPSHDPFTALPPPRDFAFVHRAWQGVIRALASQMPYGPQGDLASFSDDSLAVALATELSAPLGGPTSRVTSSQESATSARQNRR